ncbi:tetratricopeptide repeat protein [Herbaspirillum seropedicae]|uniref:Lipoprotein n=2 Tax=Herbaspirillum seropedicae TaxID=964 RepID=D8ISU3_HERSS|nr:tetratricopeptide repeat protein [Herbaspirillum seropedicae]ADJ65509.1 lipoprotein [Herbaspirillum seropedicae SmR1]AKN67339.1 lipoprotein [Herbaspirillum seropedicae]NQE31932.1 lipoprotein [Herbaspirillum seropedicae]UMU23345.1 tetratricopeptide repeat protein [Herbaspirillum seropedicae]
MRASKLNVGLIVSAMLVLALGGCTNIQPKSNPGDDAKNALESGLAQANAAHAEGKTDEAVSVLKAVASRFPADKNPWIRIAQLRFDAGDYSDAIVNAQEALRRDPGDKVANGVVTLSGLRLAVKSSGDLRAQNALNGTLKAEAQDLTKILRENLGENNLVPQPKAVTPPRARGKAARKTTSASDTESGNGSGPNPFGNLK